MMLLWQLLSNQYAPRESFCSHGKLFWERWKKHHMCLTNHLFIVRCRWRFRNSNSRQFCNVSFNIHHLVTSCVFCSSAKGYSEILKSIEVPNMRMRGVVLQTEGLFSRESNKTVSNWPANNLMLILRNQWCIVFQLTCSLHMFELSYSWIKSSINYIIQIVY